MRKVQNSMQGSFRRVLIVALLLFVSTTALAQSEIRGRVTDSNGQPLVGVSVVEVGTTNGTITDIDGNYILRTKPNARLSFSYIGFKGREMPGNQARNVALEEDDTSLNEVVVVGYGTMRRKDVTSSITTVSAKDLNVGVYTEPAQLLQGKVPGLVVAQTSDPNGSASIALRGASSLRTGTAMEPYYVIDGVPGASLSLVSPDDIETIDVLRDASATAIYGSKAANGVIIVTTKKGNKRGVTNVSYNGYVAIDNVMRTLDMMTADELLAYANENSIDISDYYDTSNPANTKWQDEVLRTGFSHNHTLSISGGQGKTSYSASLSYMNKEGVIQNTSRERMGVRSLVQTSVLKDHLDLSVSMNAAISNSWTVPMNTTTGQSVIEAMYYYNPLVPVKNEDGTWYSNYNISSNYNPVSMCEEDTYKTTNKYLQGIGKATLHIIDGLDWNLNMSYENRQILYNNYESTQSQLPSTQTGRAYRGSVETKRKSLETYGNYEHTFADAHKLGFMAGYSWEQEDANDGFGVTAYNFYNDDLSYYNLTYANSMDGISGLTNYNLSTLRMISFYGRVNYGYKSRYLFQATVRRDGSSAFGANNRWGTFPSVSAAWRITEEPFMQKQSLLDDLKLRVGYGVSGNSLGFDAYYALATYGSAGWFTASDGGSYQSLGPTRNSNPDLKWEKTAMLNVGIDFSLLKNRIGGTIEVYYKKTSDLIYDYSVSATKYPYTSMTANVGDISNKGIEFTLNLVPVQKKSWFWSTDLIISHNVNKVVKLTNDTYSVDYLSMGWPDIGGYSGMSIQRIYEGDSIGTFYLWKWAGYDENGGSIFNDYDEDGNLIGTTDAPDDTDRVKMGSGLPKVSFGWNNTVSYKNWGLTAFFNGVAGNKIFNVARCYFSQVTLIANGKNVLASVATDQLATDSRAQAPSDRYLENGSYFRLAALTLSYTFDNLGDWMKSIKVYATCNNVFTLTKYTGIDPEVSLSGLEPGVDYRSTQYPRTRSFLLGVNINF